MRIPSAEGVGVSVENGPARVARSFAHARAVADAILYEGYLLYPYRRSSGKNRVRWQFGVIVPPAWADAHGLTDTSVAGSAEAPWQQTECLLSAPDDAAVTCRSGFCRLSGKVWKSGFRRGPFIRPIS